MFGRRKPESPDERDMARLQRLYAGLGLGFPAEALQLFEGGDSLHGSADDAGRWCLRHLGRRVRCVRTPELSDRELFAIPRAWEVMRVVARSLTGRRTRRGDKIFVQGEMYCRPSGTWEYIRIPFQHVWTICAGKAVLFQNILDETELKPETVPTGRA
jgi:hypothetical protein